MGVQIKGTIKVVHILSEQDRIQASSAISGHDTGIFDHVNPVYHQLCSPDINVLRATL